MIPPSFCVAMVFTPCIHTSEALKASKSQQRKLLPYTSQRENKNHTSHKPSKSTTIHPATPSTPSLQTYPRHQSIRTPIPEKEAPPQRNPRVPIKLPKQLSPLILYLPCKPTKTKTPKQGAGENSSPAAGRV